MGNPDKWFAGNLLWPTIAQIALFGGRVLALEKFFIRVPIVAGRGPSKKSAPGMTVSGAMGNYFGILCHMSFGGH